MPNQSDDNSNSEVSSLFTTSSSSDNPGTEPKIAPAKRAKRIGKPKSITSSSMYMGASKYKKLLWPLLGIFLIIIGILLYVYKFKDVDFTNPLNIPGADDVGDVVTGITGDTFENPLNGRLVSKADAREFKDLKPIAVMVNNYVIARPSAGLSQADVIYEAVAESGITRLMPIFYSETPEAVSSIRSARYYFVQLAAGYSAHYVHWGAAHQPPCQKVSPSDPTYCPRVNGVWETEPDTDAYDEIVKWGVPNLDGGNYSCDAESCAFSRDPNKLGKVPLEHTAFVRLPLIRDFARKIRPEESWNKYMPITEWEFKDDAPMEERGDIGATTPITYRYWDTPAGFNVKWEYDKENNNYIRYQGDVKQTDANNGQELRAKSIIVRFTEQEPVGDKKNHLYHELVGQGDVLIFQDGNVIEATWIRTNPDERDQYVDANGKPIELVRGQIWVQLLPIGNTVSYQAAQ